MEATHNDISGNPRKRPLEEPATTTGKDKKKTKIIDKLHDSLGLDESNLADPVYRREYNLQKRRALEYVRSKVNIKFDQSFASYPRLTQQKAEEKLRESLVEQFGFVSFLLPLTFVVLTQRK